MVKLSYSTTKLFVPNLPSRRYFQPNTENLDMLLGKLNADVPMELKTVVAFKNVSMFIELPDGESDDPKIVTLSSGNSSDKYRIFGIAFCSAGRNYSAGMVVATLENVAMQIRNACQEFCQETECGIVIDDDGIDKVFDSLRVGVPSGCVVRVYEWQSEKLCQVRGMND